MAILFQMESCEIELIDSFRLLWRKRSFGSIGYRTNRIRLSLPFQQRHGSGILSSVDVEFQITQLLIAYFYCLNKYFLW